jgi:hypothetical protein
MWTVIKFEKKKLELMKHDISKKITGITKYYVPKMLIQYYKKNKLINKEINLLGDYIFCYNESLRNKNCKEAIKFSRGLKYLLNGSESEIDNFIETCRNFEDKKGYVNFSFLNVTENNSYKFTSGPFVNEIFKVIGLQKNKIDILIGKIKTTFNKEEFLFIPV